MIFTRKHPLKNSKNSKFKIVQRIYSKAKQKNKKKKNNAMNYVKYTVSFQGHWATRITQADVMKIWSYIALADAVKQNII